MQHMKQKPRPRASVQMPRVRIQLVRSFWALFRSRGGALSAARGWSAPEIGAMEVASRAKPDDLRRLTPCGQRSGRVVHKECRNGKASRSCSDVAEEPIWFWGELGMIHICQVVCF